MNESNNSTFYSQKMMSNIIKGVSLQYSAILYLNLSTGTCVPYALEGLKALQVEKYLNGVEPYFDDIASLYIKEVVVEGFKENISSVCRTEMIREKLKLVDTFSIVYKIKTKDGSEYCQMKITKVEEENGVPTFAVIGFVSNPRDILMEYINAELRDKYDSIYLVDVANDEYYMEHVSDNASGFEKNKKGRFSQVVSQYALCVAEKDRELWKHFSDFDFVKKYLKDTNEREIFYTVINDKRPWRHAIINVIEKINGEITLFLFAVQHLSHEYEERMALHETIEQQQSELKKALAMAQSANHAKTIFLNSMSHDIRTPMNAIIGYTNLASSHIDNVEQVKDYLEKISNSSNHLLSLINDILDMSRVESGKLSINEAPENLINMIRAIYDIVQPEIYAKRHSFHINIDNVKNENVLCDKLRLTQVLVNILSNAIKYTQRSGSISMCVKELASQKPGCSIYEFSVQDNGIGMTDEYLKIIFDPFTRMQSTTVSGIQGTGLGMAITKKIVDMMNGNIDVKSSLGNGTKMVVTLELKTCNAIKQQENVCIENDIILVGKKVLLVDDNAVNREICFDILADSGVIVKTASDGDEAVEIIKNSKDGDFDIVLMDVQMPRMNGYEATKAIRALPNQQNTHLPIIALSANAFDEDKMQALNAGMDEYVTKPIDINLLKKAIAKYIK